MHAQTQLSGCDNERSLVWGRTWHGRKHPCLFLDHKFETQSWKRVHRVNVTKRYHSKLNKSCPSCIPVVAAASSYSNKYGIPWPVCVHTYIVLLSSFTLSGYIYGKAKKYYIIMHVPVEARSILRSHGCVWLLCKLIKRGSVEESILISQYILACEVCIILFFSCSKKLVVLKMKLVNWIPMLMTWLNLLVILFLLCSLRCKSLHIQMNRNLQKFHLVSYRC